MKKVAIVGVEGSGKTVLMAAMGEKYRKPGADGLFLYANSRKTIEYCNSQIDILRNQRKWPGSTSPDALVNLEWTLMRRKEGSRPEEFCTVSFLDFAGEIYRYAFGDSTDEADQVKQLQYKSQIDAIKSHIEDAEALIVLVNLSDIINSRGASKKATEMDWLSQRIFDFAFSETSIHKRVAIVFTQKDLYDETIASCGGLEGAFEQYFPSIFYRHESKIVPFAVSAVNKTVLDESGHQFPASDFDSEGFDELVQWMASRVWTEVDDFVRLWRGQKYDIAAQLVQTWGDLDSLDLPEEAMWALADMYEHGLGVKQDYNKATKWYEKVINDGEHSERECFASEHIQKMKLETEKRKYKSKRSYSQLVLPESLKSICRWCLILLLLLFGVYIWNYFNDDRIPNMRTSGNNAPDAKKATRSEKQEDVKQAAIGEESLQNPSVDNRRRNSPNQTSGNSKRKPRRESEDDWLKFDTDEAELDIKSDLDDFNSEMDSINNRLRDFQQRLDSIQPW